MGLFSGIVSAVSKVGATVLKTGAAIASNPITQAVAGMIPGGSAVLGVASAALNSPLLKVASKAVAAVSAPALKAAAPAPVPIKSAPAPVAKPTFSKPPASAVKASAAKQAAWLPGYRAVTGRMVKRG